MVIETLTPQDSPRTKAVSVSDPPPRRNSVKHTTNFEEYLAACEVWKERGVSDLLDNTLSWLDAERKWRRENRIGIDLEAEQRLDNLEAMLLQRSTPTASRPASSRRSSARKKSLGIPPTPGSDTEYASDGGAVVPECEEWLKIPEEIGMDAFRLEVLKLAHTLRCKGWRRVDLGRYKEVEISKISGALTNAVFMVTPPPDVPPSASSTTSLHAPRQPPKLLLRIYGPQVSHLIDRDTELYILRRLARQKIGPRLLGTFTNGRFEEFFTATTLQRSDIRVPDTSRHIAKRLKELHEGIELEDAERSSGPIVWKNWDKWTARCSNVMSSFDAHRSSDLICGAPWSTFQAAVETYRTWLIRQYGGSESLKNRLVFAHNDTQYGNILRLLPDGKSPLLLPMNEHRQLVVIDFEYASAGTPAYEFANHFCEWMADYHHPQRSWFMDETQYPSDTEMRNFIQAYVDHSLRSSSQSQFNLDALEVVDNTLQVQKETDRLMEEVKWWRPASSAMWTAWGIVQAKPEPVQPAEVVVEEEFDYLKYAQQRALLFWGDCLELGIFSREMLESMQKGLGEMVKVDGEGGSKLDVRV